MKSTEAGKRAAAERRVDQGGMASSSELPSDREELIHELQVHQIELEMQNDELEHSHVELQRLREEYQELFDEAPVPYFIFDRTGRIVTANNAAARLLDATHKQLEKKPFITFLPASYHTVFFEHIRRVFASDTHPSESDHTNVELELRRRSAADPTLYIYMESRGRSRRDGPPECLSAVFDITDKKAVKDELIRAREAAVAGNRAKDEFLASMSHELRTPLNAILGFGGMLRDEGGMSERHADFVDEIVDAGSHLLSIVNEVLDLSRIERGDVEIHAETLVCTDLVDEALSIVRSSNSSDSGNIQLENRVPEIVRVYADQTRLKQVLLNLFSNAVKYNRPDGTVTVNADAHDGRVRIIVTDSGYGIPKDQQDQLFEPFNRLGREAGDIPGNGIGLTLSKRLVTLMDGSLTFTSEEQHGTTFIVELPGQLHDPQQEPVVTQSNAPETTSTYRAEAPSRTVLYVEDNPSNTKLVTSILAKHDDITLLTADTGKRGLELAENHVPELILMDINLPDMTGFDVLQTIRKSSWGADVPVVAVTADAMDTQITAAGAAGFTDYVTKPLDLARFMTVIRTLLDAR
jgi:PAS domain S-box-containing protein